MVHYQGSGIRRYGIAVLAAATAIILRQLTEPVIDGVGRFFLFTVAITGAGLFGGGGPALLATALLAAAGDYLYLKPVGSFAIAASDDVLRLVLLVIEGAAIAVLCEWLFRSRTARTHAESRIHSLADSVPTIIWTAKADGQVEYFNRRWFEYIGLGPDRPEAWDWRRVVHPDDLPGMEAATKRSLETGVAFDHQLRLRGADGRYRTFVDRAVPANDGDGRIVGWNGSATDVEDHRRLAESEAVSRAKDQFLMTISHELRTPLTAVSGWAAMIRRFGGRLGEERQAMGLAAIERGVGTLTRIVADLLDYSRIVAGKFRLNPGTADLAAVVRTALETVRMTAEEKGVILESVLDPAAGRIAGDAVRLEQAVWNLLSNAVKFTPAGKRVLVRLDRDGDRARITVADEGRGIPPEARPHVFERFWQVDADGDAEQGGMGLGLPLVRHLVEAHGGTVLAESPGAGKGATFTVRLPLAPEPPIAHARMTGI